MITLPRTSLGHDGVTAHNDASKVVIVIDRWTKNRVSCMSLEISIDYLFYPFERRTTTGHAFALLASEYDDMYSLFSNLPSG